MAISNRGAMMVAEPVTDVWGELQQCATERDLTLFQGMPGTDDEELDSLSVAEWNGDVVGFLDVAKAVGVTLIYVEQKIFAYGDALIEPVRVESPSFDPNMPTNQQDESAVWMYERLQERTRDYARRDGETRSVQCAWTKDGILHRYTSRPDWFDEFTRLVTAVEIEAEFIDRENQIALSTEDAKRVKRLADELARHPRFTEANSEAKRRFMAEQLFPDEPGLYSVVSLAELVYWWDVQPVERATKAQRVRELYDSGMSVTAIGGVLNLSTAKVRALLAQTEATE